MSGEYYTIEGPDCDGEWRVLRPDGSHVAYAGDVDRECNYSARRAEQFRDELNRLAARSGSPEGWPEGAELVALQTLNAAPEDWQLWNSFNERWIEGGAWVQETSPHGLLVVARRKPKPVTRTMRADEVRGTVRVLHDGEVAAIQPSAHVFDTDGRAVTRIHFVRAESLAYFFDCPPAYIFSALVEEPNG